MANPTLCARSKLYSPSPNERVKGQGISLNCPTDRLRQSDGWPRRTLAFGAALP